MPPPLPFPAAEEGGHLQAPSNPVMSRPAIPPPESSPGKPRQPETRGGASMLSLHDLSVRWSTIQAE